MGFFSKMKASWEGSKLSANMIAEIANRVANRVGDTTDRVEVNKQLTIEFNSLDEKTFNKLCEGMFSRQISDKQLNIWRLLDMATGKTGLIQYI